VIRITAVILEIAVEGERYCETPTYRSQCLISQEEEEEEEEV